jgi:hypothetical protein
LKCLKQEDWQYGPPSSERFQLFGQNIVLDQPGISIGTRSTIQAYPDSSALLLQRPLFLGGLSNYFCEEIVAAAHKFLEKTQIEDTLGSRIDPTLTLKREALNKIRSRLTYALEWFRLAHLDSWDIAEKTRLSFLASGIESACGISANKVETGKTLNLICRSQWTIDDAREVGPKSHTSSRLSWWFLEFYDLRSEIIHGGNLQNDKFMHQIGAKTVPCLASSLFAGSDSLNLPVEYRVISVHSVLGPAGIALN